MPVELTAPGMQDSKKSPLHLPIVLLENSQTFRGCRKENVTSSPVIELEEFMEIRRNSEHDMKVGTICQPLTDRLRPLSLPGPEAKRTMAVTARAWKPFATMAFRAFGLIKPQLPVPTMSDEIECRILRLAQSTRPTRPEFPQKAIDTQMRHRCSYKHSSDINKLRCNPSVLMTFNFARNFSSTSRSGTSEASCLHRLVMLFGYTSRL